MEKVPPRQLLLTESHMPGVCRNRCASPCQRCCPLGNVALQERLLVLPGLASSLEISRWPHRVRLSLQQLALQGNFRKPCTTSERDKLKQGKHFWWESGCQKICLLCHQSQKRAKCLTNLLVSGQIKTWWNKTTDSSRTVDKIWLVTKGEHEGALVCFARAAALNVDTWTGIALEDVKLLLILLAKLWNHIGTAIYHILLFSGCETSIFCSITGL